MELSRQQQEALAEARQGPLYRGYGCWKRGPGASSIPAQTVSALVRKCLLRLQRVGNEMAMVLTDEGKAVLISGASSR